MFIDGQYKHIVNKSPGKRTGKSLWLHKQFLGTYAAFD